MIHYGSDGCAVVNPDGFVSGDRYVLRKLAMVFTRKSIPFLSMDNGLLLNPVPDAVAVA